MPLTTEECIACGHNRFSPLYEDTLRQCGRCGFVTANADADDATLKRLYQSAYFDGEEVFDYLGTKHSRQRNFTKRLRRVLDIIGPETIGNVLEIGAAYGFFGEVLLREAPDARYRGIDVAREPARHARETLGLDVRYGDYLVEQWDAPFDTVFLWDVIEHLPRPQEFMHKIAREMVPGGHLVVGTPDIDTPLPRLRGRRWRNIHPPTHQQYFSAATLSRFLDRHGFDTVASLHPPVWRSARLIYHFTVLKRMDNALTRALFNRIPHGLTIPVNTLDNLVLIARRRGGEAAA